MRITLLDTTLVVTLLGQRLTGSTPVIEVVKSALLATYRLDGRNTSSAIADLEQYFNKGLIKVEDEGVVIASYAELLDLLHGDTKDGFRVVANTAVRDSIPLVARSLGMFVTTTVDNKIYCWLGGGLTDWVEWPITRDVGIVCIGDSHTNGQLPISTVGANVTGIYPLNGAKDKEWNGTSDNPCFTGRGCNDAAGITDASLGIDNTVPSFTMFLPQVLRRSSSKFGRIRLVNLGAGGASSYSWSASSATGFLDVATIPDVNDTVTVDTVTYTFKAAAAQANEVTIGASKEEAAANLARAISAEGAGYGAGTVANPTIFCGAIPTGHVVSLTSRAIGALGNGNVLAVTGTNVTIIAQMTNGGLTGLLANAIAKVPAGFGTVDVVTITLGTNDAARMGWRGAGFQLHMEALCQRIEAQWPGVRIVMWKPCVSGGGAAITNALTGSINPAIAAVVAAKPLTRSFVDMYALGAGSGSSLILNSGGTHLTGYGYALAAELFGNAIAATLNMS